MNIKTYSELVRFNSFEDRLRYASIGGKVGAMTFGGQRVLNQDFYRSAEWKRVRDFVIIRDGGCDLAISNLPITGKIIVHHLNPIRISDLEDGHKLILNPDFMVCVSLDTHNAIHYGIEELSPNIYVQRTPNDTCPWKSM